MHANPSGYMVTARGDAFLVDGERITRLMTCSQFLRYCACCLHAGQRIDVPQAARPKAWISYVVLVLPDDGATVDEIESTRVLRLLLAAAIAEGEGE